jgi:hypothetical protein
MPEHLADLEKASSTSTADAMKSSSEVRDILTKLDIAG